MSPELATYLQSMQDAAHRIERLLNAADALLDMPGDEVRDAAFNLVEIARHQARKLNQSLDSAALAKVAS